ncbi:hypothetical protein EYF80_046480 [Liparis tanakae]|uniref:Uncharacterized protein n=1 Tax=Liparis tanakae TaxID=230148 RepID=A0A4Z2FRJ0_9TELE|nr:hypothetical protein EYF80_046480 [Liparis tanakae]
MRRCLRSLRQIPDVEEKQWTTVEGKGNFYFKHVLHGLTDALTISVASQHSVVPQSDNISVAKKKRRENKKDEDPSVNMPFLLGEIVDAFPLPEGGFESFFPCQCAYRATVKRSVLQTEPRRLRVHWTSERRKEEGKNDSDERNVTDSSREVRSAGGLLAFGRGGRRLLSPELRVPRRAPCDLAAGRRRGPRRAGGRTLVLILGTESSAGNRVKSGGQNSTEPSPPSVKCSRHTELDRPVGHSEAVTSLIENDDEDGSSCITVLNTICWSHDAVPIGRCSGVTEM